MKKTLFASMTIATALFLGACGSEGVVNEEGTNNSEQVKKEEKEVVEVNENELLLIVDGKEKIIPVETKRLHNNATVKLPENLRFQVEYTGGNSIVGLGDLEGVYIKINERISNGGMFPSLAVSEAFEIVAKAGAVSYEELDITKYPELVGKYESLMTALNQKGEKIYGFAIEVGNNVRSVAVTMKNDKATPENEALIRAIAASVEYK